MGIRVIDLQPGTSGGDYRPQVALRVSATAGDQAKASARTTAAQADSAKSGLSGMWDHAEPGRKMIEFILAPVDTVAADHWIDGGDGRPAQRVAIRTGQGIRRDRKLPAGGHHMSCAPLTSVFRTRASETSLTVR
jgi:hypothetical protein